MHVHLNMCVQYKTTLYISQIPNFFFISLKGLFMLRERERERGEEMMIKDRNIVPPSNNDIDKLKL